MDRVVIADDVVLLINDDIVIDALAIDKNNKQEFINRNYSSVIKGMSVRHFVEYPTILVASEKSTDAINAVIVFNVEDGLNNGRIVLLIADNNVVINVLTSGLEGSHAENVMKNLVLCRIDANKTKTILHAIRDIAIIESKYFFREGKPV